jgi:hypothetical protein
VALGLYRSLPKDSLADKKGQTFEALMGDAMEEGIERSTAGSARVLLYQDEAGRTSTDGLHYVGESGSDPRHSDPGQMTARLQTEFLECDSFFQALHALQAPINKKSSKYIAASVKWQHTQRDLRRWELTTNIRA